jgi:hypothetical protein
MLIAVCDRSTVCGVWSFNSYSVRGVRSSVWQCARQCAAAQLCARAAMCGCPAVRQCA